MDTLIHQVFSVIQASLHGESHQRAEEAILVLDKEPAFALALCRLVEDANVAVEHRLASAIQLFKTLSVHYDSALNKFLPPEIPSDHKPFIRLSLLRSIITEHDTLRTNIARCLSCVANTEFPEVWPSLPDVLACGLCPSLCTHLPSEFASAFNINSLSSLPESSLHFLSQGLSLVAAKLAEDICDTKLTSTITTLSPALLNSLKIRLSTSPSQILSSSSLEFVLYISNAFYNLLTTASYLVQDSAHLPKNSPKIKTILAPILPPWLEVFSGILSAPLVPPSITQSLPDLIRHLEAGYLAPFIQSIKILTLINQLFSKEMVEAGIGASIIEAVLSVYRTCSSLYEALFILHSEPLELSTSLKDSSGEAQNLLTLVDACQGFFSTTLMASRSARKLVKSKISDLLEITIMLMRIDRQSIFDWTSSIDRYYAAEDETTFDYSVRIAAKIFMGRLADSLPQSCIKLYTSVAFKLFRQAQVARSTGGNDHYWMTTVESVFVGFTSILPSIDSFPPEFDWNGFVGALVSVFDVSSSSSTLPFLVVRALSTLAHSIQYLPETLVPQVAERVAITVESSASTFVTGLSLGALTRLLEAIKEGGDQEKPSSPIDVVRNVFVNRIRELLLVVVNFLGSAQESSDALHVGVDCLQHLVDLFSGTPALRNTSDLIAQSCLHLWKKFSSDPLLCVGLIDVLQLASKDDSTGDSLLAFLLPDIMGYLEGDNEVSMQTAIDLLSSFLSNRSESKPLPSILIDRAFPCVCQRMLSTDDAQVLQAGSDLLRHYLRLSAGQLSQLKFEVNFEGVFRGVSGVECVYMIISKLLDPKIPEDAALFIGGLIVRILRTFISSFSSQMLSDLLMSMFKRFLSAKLFAFQQCLLLVVAHLYFLIPPDSFLNLLFSIQNFDPKYSSGFDCFFKNFAEFQPNFFGSFDIKVALAFSSSIISNSDPRLDSLQVFGDSVDGGGLSGVSTRAQRISQATSERVIVPLKVKLFKNIISVGFDYLEDLKTPKFAQESDDEAEDFLDQDDGNITGSSFVDMDDFQFLDQLVGDETYEGAASQENEFKNVEIFNFEPLKYIAEFSRKLANDPVFAPFGGFLSKSERTTIATLVQLS
ncbi:hypothetical protein RCL1_000018 [Eukaryota sp. TZLM3-RCL]